MKNLNLSFIALIFSSLLIGCGMKGPLYKADPQVEQKQQAVDKTEASNVAETKQ
ncbi:lipoprotein [Psychromonas sp.]|nr:lipoprotein [Psychromonas sp.]